MHKCVADIQPAREFCRGDTYALKASSKEHHLMHHSQIFRDIWHLKLNYVTVVECWLLEKIGDFGNFDCFIIPGLLKNLLHILDHNKKSLLSLKKIQQFKMGWVEKVSLSKQERNLLYSCANIAAMQTQFIHHKVHSRCPACRSFPLIPNK